VGNNQEVDGLRRVRRRLAAKQLRSQGHGGRNGAGKGCGVLEVLCDNLLLGELGNRLCLGGGGSLIGILRLDSLGVGVGGVGVGVG
jgi:hypothetical protein